MVTQRSIDFALERILEGIIAALWKQFSILRNVENKDNGGPASEGRIYPKITSFLWYVLKCSVSFKNEMII